MGLLTNKLFQSSVAAVALFLYVIEVAIAATFLKLTKPSLFVTAVQINEIPLLAGGCLITICAVLYQSSIILKKSESPADGGKLSVKNIGINLFFIFLITSILTYLHIIEVKSPLVQSVIAVNLLVALSFPFVSLIRTLITAYLSRFAYTPALNFFSRDGAERKTVTSHFFTTHSFVVNMCRREKKPLLIAGVEITNISDIETAHGQAARVSLLEQVLLLLNEYSRNYERWAYDYDNSIFYNFFMISSKNDADNISSRIEPAFDHTNFAVNEKPVSPSPVFHYLCLDPLSLPPTAAVDENVLFLKNQISSLRSGIND